MARRYRKRKKANRGKPRMKMAKSIKTIPNYFFKRSVTQTLDLHNALFNTSLIRLDNENSPIVPALDAITLGSLPAYTDFTALFGGYKINAVKYKITPSYTMTSALGISGAVPPQINLITIYDPFDNLSSQATVNTEAILNQYQNRKTRHLIRSNQGKPISTYFKTAQQTKVNLTGLADGVATVRPRWCSTAETSVQHYGPALFLKLSNDTLFSNHPGLTLKVEMEYYLQFKNVM